jgi:GntR family transcriptional regulator
MAIGIRESGRADDASMTSVLRLRIDTSDATPLHDQVGGQIRRSIAEGDARPGDRLPPAKDLAAVMGVNTNTVLRALRELRDEGLLEFRRGLGIRVAGTPERGLVLSKTRELIRLGRRNGYDSEELVGLIRTLS